MQNIHKLPWYLEHKKQDEYTYYNLRDAENNIITPLITERHLPMYEHILLCVNEYQNVANDNFRLIEMVEELLEEKNRMMKEIEKYIEEVEIINLEIKYLKENKA